ncbi:myosin regulatory light chain 2 [Tribolium madens]|uniref:myosin regulatory light chain 2 n=1 Tax=Tribolium madens TaxID=41895 RepID=UPI001CF758BD|nr:myosin regulatory light chain 2 [Tribolium madens]
MADKEKKVKKKKKEDAPEAAPAPAETRTSSKGSSKKVKRSGSNVFSMFSQAQVAEFKEGFQLMDHDKDGIITKADLRATFDAVGKLSNEKELDEMINEAPGPLNFTQLLGLFGTRMQDSGGTDDDEVVVAAFKSFDENGTIDSERFRHALMTWGDKFTAKEVDDAFDAMDIDDKGRIDTQGLIQLLTAAPEEEGEGEAA